MLEIYILEFVTRLAPLLSQNFDWPATDPRFPPSGRSTATTTPTDINVRRAILLCLPTTSRQLLLEIPRCPNQLKIQTTSPADQQRQSAGPVRHLQTSQQFTLSPVANMCIVFTCGEQECTKPVSGYEGLTCQCHHCVSLSSSPLLSPPASIN